MSQSFKVFAVDDDPVLRHTLLIFVSGHDLIEERTKGFDADGEDYIVRPFESEEPLRKLMVAKNRVFDQRTLAVRAEEAVLPSSDFPGPWSRKIIFLPFNGEAFCKRLLTNRANAEVIARYEHAYAETLMQKPKSVDKKIELS